MFIICKKKWKAIIEYSTRCFQKNNPKAGEYLGNKTENSVTKSNDDNIEKQKPVEEIIIRPEKRDEILNKLKIVL